MFDPNFWLNHYPGTNFHELNIDWIIAQIKELAHEMQEFTIVNSIKYGGAWDITKQYAPYTIVSVNGTEGYISIKPVPAGIDYTNTDYWRVVADFTVQLAGIAQRVSDLENEVPKIYTEIRNNTWLDGKKVVWYGDSWGTTADNPVDKFIARYPNVTVDNRCIGGTLLTRTTEFPGFENNSGYQRILAATDLNLFDYIFIMYGVNDWQTSRVIKTDSPDEYEYNYCVDAIIDHLQSTFPNCIPVFIFQTYCYKSFSTSDLNCVNYAGSNLPAYINNAIDICERHNIRYINLFELSGLNRLNYSEHLRNDSGVYVHLKPRMSEEVAKIIFEGITNTGKCYGDSWSNNLVESTIDMSAIVTKAESVTTIHDIVTYPMKKITSGDVHSMCINPSNDKTTVIHFTGYKADTDTNGIYIDRQMVGEANARLGIANINKEGLIDSYIEVPRSDLINIAIVTSGSDAIIYGCNASIRGDNTDIKSIFVAPTKEAHVVADFSSFNPTVENGIITIPSYQFSVDADIAAFSTLLTNLPRGYANDATYLIGFDASAGSAINFYMYNGGLRTGKQLINGHTYIIPATTFKTPH